MSAAAEEGEPVMSLRQAAQQALEALERGETKLRWAAITALRAALAEPEQEPVAWGYELATTVGEHGYEGWSRRVTHAKPNVPKGSIRNLTPLYTSPAPRKPLTDYINAAGINGADSPHMVVEKLQSAIERAHGIGEQT